MAREKAVEMQVNLRVNDALARLGREESDISKEFTPEINDLIEDLRGQKGLSRAAGAYVVHAILGVACSGIPFHLIGAFGAPGTQDLALLCGPTGARRLRSRGARPRAARRARG